MKEGEWYIPLKIYRDPNWSGAKFTYEFKDEDQNSFGASGLSFDEIIEIIKKHFEIKEMSINEPDERDEKSIKCSDCGGHIMLFNSISYVNAVDSQYRPIYGEEAEVELEGSCISNPLHHHKFKGILIVKEVTE